MIGSIAWGALGALWALDGVRLRKRAQALAVASPADQPPSPSHVFLTRPGAELPEAVQRAASAHATSHGLEVLDLVPEGMRATDAFLMVQAIDFATFRNDRLAKALSAGEAILVDAALAARLGPLTPLETPLDFARLAQRLKQYAPVAMDFAVIPGLTASPRPHGARALIDQVFGDFARPVIRTQLALALAGPIVAPITGTLALAAIHLQSAVALGGTTLRPRGLAAHVLFRTPSDFLRTLGAPAPDRQDATGPSAKGAMLEHRKTYESLLASGTDRFFEARRDDCPFCGGKDLQVHLDTTDLLQHKPGRFVLERCTGCGHIFQNPRLSIEGLGFYYRDFYDGLGEAGLEGVFASAKDPYFARARHVEAEAKQPPRRWLDVGTGHAHFCNLARDVFPTTTFEGVDLSDSLAEAERRGWITRGHKALFPDVAGELARDPYDVVSMSHYLEHTREPEAELDAAKKVLRPGGLLMIELPDPESPYGRALGRYWLPWFQPQHQHLLSVARAETLLRRHGFEPLSWQRAEAHQPVDFVFAVGMLVGKLTPSLGKPWRPEVGRAGMAWSKAVWTLALPPLALARAADLAVAPIAKKRGWSNTFRVVARRA